MKLAWRIFWHIVFWVCGIAFFVFISRNPNRPLTVQHVLIVWVLYGAINISLFYLNYLLFIPRFLNKKRYGLYIIIAVVTIAIYGVAKYGVGLVFENDILVMHYKGAPTEIETFSSYFLTTVFVSLIFLFLSFVLKLGVDWVLNDRVQRDLENQRLSAELAFLKSQINPHFLFNSLNSIYSLAYQKSDTTPEAILKLSEIMRYMLYECNDNKVDLSREMQYLQNFIDLQKIRFGNKAYIDFKVEGQVRNQKIVPLLLIAFIENAFKHGIANNTASPIRLLITLDDAHLHFYIQNKKHSNNRDSAGGIGLNNVKRRLDLLYPGKYNLDIKDEIDTYTCELSLIL